MGRFQLRSFLGSGSERKGEGVSHVSQPRPGCHISGQISCAVNRSLARDTLCDNFGYEDPKRGPSWTETLHSAE